MPRNQQGPQVPAQAHLLYLAAMSRPQKAKEHSVATALKSTCAGWHSIRGYLVAMPISCDVMKVLKQLAAKCGANALRVKLHAIVWQVGVRNALQHLISRCSFCWQSRGAVRNGCLYMQKAVRICMQMYDLHPG